LNGEKVRAYCPRCLTDVEANVCAACGSESRFEFTLVDLRRAQADHDVWNAILQELRVAKSEGAVAKLKKGLTLHQQAVAAGPPTQLTSKEEAIVDATLRVLELLVAHQEGKL
jgi:hypothetical protein